MERRLHPECAAAFPGTIHTGSRPVGKSLAVSGYTGRWIAAL